MTTIIAASKLHGGNIPIALDNELLFFFIDSSQCLAQLTPARVGTARSVHVQLGASPHVIR